MKPGTELDRGKFGIQFFNIQTIQEMSVKYLIAAPFYLRFYRDLVCSYSYKTIIPIYKRKEICYLIITFYFNIFGPNTFILIPVFFSILASTSLMKEILCVFYWQLIKNKS